MPHSTSEVMATRAHLEVRQEGGGATSLAAYDGPDYSVGTDSRCFLPDLATQN